MQHTSRITDYIVALYARQNDPDGNAKARQMAPAVRRVFLELLTNATDLDSLDRPTYHDHRVIRDLLGTAPRQFKIIK